MPNRKRTSSIWKPSSEEFLQIFHECSTIGEMLSRFNLANKGGNYKTLTTRLKLENICWDKFKSNKFVGLISNRQRTCRKLGEILIVGSTYLSTSNLKSRLLKSGLLKNYCYTCNLQPEWNSQNLVMVLDHINGVRNDNRIENLRLLCPNCNSQTDTFAGRNLKYEYVIDNTKTVDSLKLSNIDPTSKIVRIKKQNVQKFCINCNKPIHKISTLCLDCSNKSPKLYKRKVERPIKEDLQKLVWSIPTIEIAKRFGVSDKAINKWCKSYNIDKPGRGYWTKQKYENH